VKFIAFNSGRLDKWEVNIELYILSTLDSDGKMILKVTNKVKNLGSIELVPPPGGKVAPTS